ncbi:MAG: ABC transporter substrate-binding protein [Candidatus Dormibacteraeota bacterium]|uniref:ABC transporter substrate-binding protein n=1 Tax=Candidatus Nephthysia bennettiae TaxID=3127016 RepID=A0A934NBM3_9BACT|nr:ABC transporter substrate-binding protein [Candidatus Dormibacteraeota bacterium]
MVGVFQEPTTLDITAGATAAIAVALRDNLYEGLVRTDPTGHVLPQLARSWDVNSDRRIYTFHLVSARWHDGTPFTAEDVKFSWERAQTDKSQPHPDYFAPIQLIEVLGDHTVRVTLKQYSDNWLFHMAQGSAAILPRSTHLVTTSPPATNLASQPIGTGPFRFKQWNRGDSLLLVRNDDYWGAKAKLQEVVFKYFSDANASNNALKAGDIDVLGAVQGPEQLGSFRGDSRFKVNQGAPTGKIIVSLNNATGNAALRDPRVRQALSYGVDRKAFIEGVEAGYAVPIGSHSVPNPSEPYYTDMTKIYTRDTGRAKQLLAAAGYASGLTLRLDLVTEFPYAQRTGQILISELQEIGVKVQAQTLGFAEWLQRDFIDGNYDLTVINHTEPRDIGNYGNPKYYWHYDNQQVRAWLGQADAELDLSKRKDLYTKIQRQIAEDAANIFLMSPDSLSVQRANLHGYPQSLVSPAIFLGDAYFS